MVKERLFLLLDVGPSMHSVLHEVEKVCFMLVQKKLMYSKDDEVGIALFGTEDTDNELNTEVGGYQNIVVLKNIEVVDRVIAESLQQLPRGTTNGDFVDAVMVGMDMLIKKFGITYKEKKRLCLITNALCSVKEPCEGTKEDQITTIAKEMTAHGIKMESIILRGKFSMTTHWYENERLLNIFLKEPSTRLLNVNKENPIPLFGALTPRTITPVAVFIGDLEFSPILSIKVKVYKKTAARKIPSMKKYSDKAPPNDEYASHEVKKEYKYKSTIDPEKVVPSHQRIKGYAYGPQIVPISSAEWDALRFKTEKGVKLLGFTDSSKISRHHYMRDVYVFLPEPGNTQAMLAISALARAMKGMNKVAILRCIWRRGQSNVIIGVLTPNLSHREHIVDSFYFNVLPFAEDVREFHFPSFTNLPASCQPNGQQLEAAANLIKLLDLAPGPGQDELLQPDFTSNPVLERFYHYLELKSKDPDAAVPPVDNTLKKIIEPDADLLLRKKPAIDSFCRSFELKGNPLPKKSRGRKRSYSNDKEAQPSNAIVESVGNLTPIQDFEALLARRYNSPFWVVKAITDMKCQIIDLVVDSQEGDNYPKALECLVVLRKGCILQQEPKYFNSFLKHLCNFCEGKNFPSFCEYFASKELTLISKTEALDSEVTDDEARSFLVTSAPKVD